jgi:hypothetical protein
MTIATDLQRQLVNYIVEHSGHEPRRRYIGLSGISDCEQVIYDRYIHGTPATVSERMKIAISYDLERVLIEKLTALQLYRKGEEIYLYNGLVQGHTDGRIRDDLLEIKTIEREEWFPQNHLPFRAFFQVQAYLHFLNINFAQVIYLARDTGAVQVYSQRRDARKGEEIASKIDRLVTAVNAMQRPECSCGRCNSK